MVLIAFNVLQVRCIFTVLLRPLHNPHYDVHAEWPALHKICLRVIVPVSLIVA